LDEKFNTYSVIFNRHGKRPVSEHCPTAGAAAHQNTTGPSGKTSARRRYRRKATNAGIEEPAAHSENAKR
jgi:hypothetical protein